MLLLTGGAGFIGYNLLQALNARGIKDIIVVDHLNHAIKEQHLKNTVYQQYYDKKDFLNRLPALEGITAILHQGACSSTTETDEVYLQENNINYSKQLLHYAIEKIFLLYMHPVRLFMVMGNQDSTIAVMITFLLMVMPILNWYLINM